MHASPAQTGPGGAPAPQLRADISVKENASTIEVIWKPQGPTLGTNCEIRCTLEKTSISLDEVNKIIEHYCNALRQPVGAVWDPLSTELVKFLCMASKDVLVSNCTVDGKTILLGHADLNLKLENVTFKKSEVAIRCHELVCEQVTLEKTVSNIRTDGGKWNETAIDQGSTVAGSLGTTELSKSVELHGCCPNMDFRQVKLEHTDKAELKARLKELVFSDVLAGPDLIAISTVLTEPEVHALAQARNKELPHAEIVAKLRLFGGEVGVAAQPLKEHFEDHGIGSVTAVVFNTTRDPLVHRNFSAQIPGDVDSRFPPVDSMVSILSSGLAKLISSGVVSRNPGGSGTLPLKFSNWRDDRRCLSTLDLLAEVLGDLLDDPIPSWRNSLPAGILGQPPQPAPSPTPVVGGNGQPGPNLPQHPPLVSNAPVGSPLVQDLRSLRAVV